MTTTHLPAVKIGRHRRNFNCYTLAIRQKTGAKSGTAIDSMGQLNWTQATSRHIGDFTAKSW